MCKIVEFLLDCLFIKDLKKDGSIITKGVLNTKDQLYTFFHLSQPKFGLMTFIAKVNECTRLWHDQLRHLNFCSLKLTVIQNMVAGLFKVLSHDGVCKGFVPRNHH